MKVYSERNIFTPDELKLLREATRLIGSIPDEKVSFVVRCHELARAAGIMLNSMRPAMNVCDGKFGIIEHSWLECISRGRHIILDVYAVGSVPMVQLIDFEGAIGLRGARKYVEGAPRTDIDEEQVRSLVILMSRSRDTSQQPFHLSR